MAYAPSQGFLNKSLTRSLSLQEYSSNRLTGGLLPDAQSNKPVMKQRILKSGLKALYYSGTSRLLAPITRGIGLIFMLHRVRPERPCGFAPNRILEVEPGFLDSVLQQVRDAGLDIVSLEEARQRIIEGGDRRFACFTLDDGYRDNAEYALPVFRKHGAPFTVYVPSAFAGGEGILWWVALEQVIAGTGSIEFAFDGMPRTLATTTDSEKQFAYHQIYWWLRDCGEDRQREAISLLCERHGVDLAKICREAILPWEELRGLSKEPLVTIGAHTANHFAVGKLPTERAMAELTEGADRLEAELGIRPRHLSYPYGDAASAGPRDFALAREAGFETAVTTRKGVIFPDHRDHLHALPRVSLNGAYQSLLYTSLYLTGAPFALWNGFRRIDAA